MSKGNCCILFIFLLIQLGIKYTQADADPIVCKNGILIQENEVKRCRCPLGWVHKDDNECVDIETLSKCEGEDSVGKPCGNYAQCKKVPAGHEKPDEIKCTCNDKYTFLSATRADNFCIPTLCKAKNCGWGKCIQLKSGDAVCSCHANFNHKTPANKLTECVTEVDLPECTLACPKDSKCIFDPAQGFYFCKSAKDILW